MQRAPLWKRAPFLRLVLPLMAGISQGQNQLFPIQPGLAGIISTSLLILSSAILLIIQSSIVPLRYRPAPLSGLLINCLLFSTGILLFNHHKITHHHNWIGYHLNHTIAIAVSPDALPSPGKKSLRYQLTIHSTIDQNGKTNPAKGKIIAYIPSGNQDLLQPGSIYLIPASNLKTITSPGNPGSFDYARFCQRKNIYHQTYLKPEDIMLLKTPTGFSLNRFLATGQSSALAAMRNSAPEPARALAMALLIGYRDEVDKDLLQAYTNTGVVHVIAVSGMHLGLIFLLLQHLLVFPENRFPITRWFKAAIVLLITWWFSGIAGAAASIIRAAFMFSLLLVAKILRKPMDPIQALSLGAFALLCYNPFWLWDAGFQLSFAALLSIVVFQPLITPWLQPKNKIAYAIWQLMAVTLAAQVLTLPISIGQFHQAPVYFLFANLLAVPLSSLALITAILQWIMSACLIPTNLAGQLTVALINWMNAFIRRIDRLPGAVLDQLEWSTTQTWLAYGIITCVTVWLATKNRRPFLLTLVSLIFFAGSRFADHATKSRQQILAVYHLPGKSAVEIIWGKDCTRMLTAFSTTKHPVLQASARYFRVTNIRYLATPLLRIHQHTLALPQNQQEAAGLLKTNPSFLLLTRQTRNIKGFANHIPAKCVVIIDGSVYENKAQQWEEELKIAGIQCHNTWTSGAFLGSLKSNRDWPDALKFHPKP
ncbi:ComEC/Rec2 family competence protein [Flavihumibacter stibioxidans]|uniref:Competence protein ComEC n=1 Tax=Flavihumibacter stibioxidans TaxID=1834163 RepID=A0ABR7M9D6_9BACT|nr:ComEC/Rec2 family competence protein [Flavihumibacter stibioxidans]MBC6491638.1 hypothetical protein [Flavihumibacter stibioxidans]